MKSDVKATAKQGKTGSKAAAGVNLEGKSFPETGERLHSIATAAYYKAEARGFMPGQELDDWLTAEAELDKVEGC